MKKLIPFALAGVFLIFVVTIPVAITQFSKSPAPTPAPTSSETQHILRITQLIQFNNGQPDSDDRVETVQGKSVLDILNQTHNVEIKEFSFGKLVESIDEVRNGADDKYWTYFINEQEASVGAAEYQVQNNDQIQWKFMKYDEK